ncbi:GNAT family N-acetyltransferase [Undibacterium sp.]|uniref:GNAT family N-acetyltransferase n=1 Tax=Undibacterium sp. TaxID=1914977 RepID=UPI003752849E
MSIQVQQATINDLDIITPLFNAYRMFYQQSSDLIVARNFLSERLQKQESVIFFAANDDAEGLGFVQLYPSFSSVSANRLWILNDLFVAESARRGGVARQLMQSAREFAITTNAKGLFLETAHDNFHGQSLYESLGYQRNSEFYYFLDLQNSSCQRLG